MEKSLKDLIARLPIPGLKESTDRHVIAEAISKELGILIQPKQIKVKESVVTISVPPVVKSVLQVKQQRLIEILSGEGLSVKSVR